MPKKVVVSRKDALVTDAKKARKEQDEDSDSGFSSSDLMSDFEDQQE